MKFNPIKTLSNIIPLNRRFRALFAAVTDILARLDALEPVDIAESVAVDPVTIAEQVEQVVASEIEKLRAEAEGREINFDKRIGAAKLKALIEADKAED